MALNHNITFVYEKIFDKSYTSMCVMQFVLEFHIIIPLISNVVKTPIVENWLI